MCGAAGAVWGTLLLSVLTLGSSCLTAPFPVLPPACGQAVHLDLEKGEKNSVSIYPGGGAVLLLEWLWASQHEVQESCALLCVCARVRAPESRRVSVLLLGTLGKGLLLLGRASRGQDALP